MSSACANIENELTQSWFLNVIRLWILHQIMRVRLRTMYAHVRQRIVPVGRLTMGTIEVCGTLQLIFALTNNYNNFRSSLKLER